MAQEKDPKLNRVTVYRTLKLLKESGLVDELDLVSRRANSTTMKRGASEHAHVICLGCGKVEGFGDLSVAVQTDRDAFRISDRAGANRDGRLLSPALVRCGRRLELAAGAYEFHDAGPGPGSDADSGGDRSERPPLVPLYPFPLRMGRGPDNNLILRDSRVCAMCAGCRSLTFVLEDLETGTASGSTSASRTSLVLWFRTDSVRCSGRLSDSLHARRRGAAAPDEQAGGRRGKRHEPPGSYWLERRYYQSGKAARGSRSGPLAAEFLLDR